MSRTRLFASMTGLVFLVNLARVVYAPLVEPLGAYFQVGPGVIGTVVTLVWVGSALLRVPTGYLLTLVPRDRVVGWSGGVLVGAASLAALADSVPALAAGALLMGLASGAYFVAANPLVSELYPERVGRAMGVHGTAAQLAAVAAAPVVGLALGLSWRAVFAGIAVGALAATLAFYALARRTEMPTASGTDRDLLGAARAQWRLILTGVAIVGFTGLVWQGVFNFYVTYMLDKGLPAATARTLLTVTFAAGVPAFLVSGRLVDRFPEVPYLLAVLGAFVAGLVALTAAQGLVALVAVSLALGYALHSLFPALDAFLLGSLPDEHRGGAYAVYSGTVTLVSAAGSSVVGFLVAAEVPFDLIYRASAGALAVVVIALAGLWLAGRLPAGSRRGAESAGPTAARSGDD